MSASRTLLFFSLLMCYIITLTSNLIGTETDWFLSFLLPIFDCWLLSLLAGLLNKIKLGIVVSVPVVAILFSELLTVFFYHSNFTIYVILLLFETNVQESTEFVHTALAHPGTWYAAAITILTGIAAYKNILVAIDAGKITLQGAASLSAVNTAASATTTNVPTYMLWKTV